MLPENDDIREDGDEDTSLEKKSEEAETTADDEAAKAAEDEKIAADAAAAAKATEEEEEETLPDYRSTEVTAKATAEDKEAAKAEMVPLKKYMDLKRELKEAKEGNGSNSFNDEDIEEIAKEFDVDPSFAKKLAKTITASATKQAQAAIAPVLQERKMAENVKNFNADFDKKILAQFGADAEQYREDFRRMAFSPDFLDLKTLNDIQKRFFPHLKKAEAGTKKETIENGSKTSVKGSSQIDFANMDEDTHMKVLADPKLKQQYYDWQENQ